MNGQNGPKEQPGLILNPGDFNVRLEYENTKTVTNESGIAQTDRKDYNCKPEAVLNINNNNVTNKDRKTHEIAKHSEVSNMNVIVERSLGISKLKVFKRRWYILLVFCIFTLSQAGVWNTWGPIASASEHAYSWKDSDIAMFTNLGPIAYIPMALPFSWLVDTKGLRWACLLACGCATLGAGLRCIVSDPPINKRLILAGHLLNGIAGPIGKGAPPSLSATWFPPHQRTTATAISFALESFGLSLSYLIGPLVVPEYRSHNVTTSCNISQLQNREYNGTIPDENEFIQKQRDSIMHYLYGMFGFSSLGFLLLVIYFPRQPPKPPSPSASTPRLAYIKGLKLLVKKRRFWQIAVIYGFSSGTREAWASMLGVNLKAHGISQTDAGWLGFYGTIAGGVAAVIVARFADIFKKRLKRFLLGLYILTMLFYLWMVLQILDYIPKSRETMYAALVFASVTASAAGPLCYELVCETTYPVAEGIANLSLTTQNNIASIIFLGILSIPNIGTVWMNWFLIATYMISILMLILLREGHHRLDVDDRYQQN